ncbi:MAG: transposase, partial [Candidatus Nitrosopolaris sp.]
FVWTPKYRKKVIVGSVEKRLKSLLQQKCKQLDIEIISLETMPHTLSRILEVTNNLLKIEINDKGTITGRYMGTQLGTTDNTTNQDGTSSWSGKFMQTTNKGEMIVATGSGTGETPNSKGIVKIRGEGDMWTQSTRLANLSGAKWTCEGESNIRKGSTVIYVNIKERE